MILSVYLLLISQFYQNIQVKSESIPLLVIIFSVYWEDVYNRDLIKVSRYCIHSKYVYRVNRYNM